MIHFLFFQFFRRSNIAIVGRCSALLIYKYRITKTHYMIRLLLISLIVFMAAEQTSQHTSNIPQTLFKLPFQIIENDISFVLGFLRVLRTTRNFIGQLINSLIYLLFRQLSLLSELPLVITLALLARVPLIGWITLLI